MPNFNDVNSIEVNGGAVQTGSGEGARLEQTVAVIGLGQMLDFDQNVQLFVTGSGQIVLFEQQVETTGVGQLVQFSQRVHDSNANTFLTRNGFTFQVVIGGEVIPEEELSGQVAITKTEGQSAIARITLYPGAGIVDPEFFQGKSITINHITATTSKRIFTGFVDTPQIDIVDGFLSLNCSDRRSSKMENLETSVIENIGTYSNIVFGEPQTNKDELDKRLQTITGSFDYDNYGNHSVTPWEPKAVANFTLTDADIYREKPDVSYSNRNAATNVVQLNMKYSYQRLHQQLCTVSWGGYENFCANWFTQGKPSFPAKETVQSSAFSDNWHPTTAINFVDLWPAQGFACVGGPVVWQPNQVTHDYVAQTTRSYLVDPATNSTTWANGKQYPIDSFVLDASGNKIYDVVSSTIVDTSSHLCRGANWKAGRKFAQTVEEVYTIQLGSLKGETKYGPVISKENYSFDDEYDTRSWEEDDLIYNSTENFYVNQQQGFSEFLSGINVALNKARATLFSSYRDVDVTFRRDIWADVDLKHTVAVNATLFTTKAKVYSFTHDIDVTTGRSETRVTLRLSRLPGVDTTDVWAVPAVIDNSGYINTDMSVALQTHTGESPDPAITPNAETWNGWIGNATVTQNNIPLHRTNFVESFIVDYPAIPDTVRLKRTLASDSSFNINIPNDTLTVTFT